MKAKNRIVTKPDMKNKDELNTLRMKIDLVDKDIIKLLSERMELSGKIGKYKKQNKINFLDKRRWREVLLARIKWGKSQGLSHSFVEKIYNIVHKESLKTQRNLLK